MHQVIHHVAARSTVETASLRATYPRQAAPATLTASRSEGKLPRPRTASLNLAERLAAQVGEWAAELSERWHPTGGPFFVSDGQLAASCVVFDAVP